MATAAPDRCPSCGAERPADAPRGHCPRCLLRQGLDGASLSLSHAGELGAGVDFSGSRVLETLAAIVGPVPRVLLRDSDDGAEPPVLVLPDRAAADPSVRYQFSSRTGVFRGHATGSVVGSAAAGCSGAARRIAMDRRIWPRSRAGRAGVGAQCGLERGTSPLRAGAAHRGDEFVSATEDCRLTGATRLARDYDPAMPGPA
jgi:hypothetical protein